MNAPTKENQVKIKRLRELLKEKANETRSILRIKALIAYYKGMSLQVIAGCYEITEKTLSDIRLFMSYLGGRRTTRVTDYQLRVDSVQISIQ